MLTEIRCHRSTTYTTLTQLCTLNHKSFESPHPHRSKSPRGTTQKPHTLTIHHTQVASIFTNPNYQVIYTTITSYTTLCPPTDAHKTMMFRQSGGFRVRRKYIYRGRHQECHVNQIVTRTPARKRKATQPTQKKTPAKPPTPTTEAMQEGNAKIGISRALPCCAIPCCAVPYHTIP